MKKLLLSMALGLVFLPAFGQNGCEAVKTNTNLPVDNYALGPVSINGNCLEVTVTNSGGCEVHKFDMVWDGVILESYPVQLNLYLHHDDGGDLCKALITRTMGFNLVPLRQQGYNTIMLRVHGPNGQSQTIAYNY